MSTAAAGSVATGSQISTAASSNTKRSAPIPSDVIRLDVLLTSGQRKFFDFAPTTSIYDVRETIFRDWPEDWPPRPASSSAIRILHLGHILDEKAVLSGSSTPGAATAAGSMPVGRSTVVHLLVRQSPTKKGQNGEDEPLKKKRRGTGGDDGQGAGCCNCAIM